MTNEEIKQLPEIVDSCLDGAILDEVRQHLNKKINEVCQLAIQALEAQQTCENINEDYADCDQFQCSECHIELQDWHRVERDNDDGEISYHEYTFRYCPNCGRRIKYDE